MLKNLRFIEEYEKDALKRMPSWIVVVRTIIIHASNKYVASTNLFGLLGDEPVRLVYVLTRIESGPSSTSQRNHSGKAMPSIPRISAEDSPIMTPYVPFSDYASQEKKSIIVS